MTKVEELLKGIERDLADTNANVSYFYDRMLRLVAAARAEGAEQIKQQIRNTCDFIAQGDEVSCTDVHYAKCVDYTEQDFAEAQTDLYVVPASLLATDKESEPKKSSGKDWDMDDVGL